MKEIDHTTKLFYHFDRTIFSTKSKISGLRDIFTEKNPDNIFDLCLYTFEDIKRIMYKLHT